ncbi:MAG: tetratricopeptide repeat protein [Phormidesmis sp. CAN_BIN36]|nr:tetratricopeptide repeat protein [Phormidesmis sp. CAN_BIN36]
MHLRHQKESIADSDKAINIYNNQWVSSFGTGTKQGSAANNNQTTHNLISEAHNIRGAAISELIGNKDAAIENYNQAIELNPALAHPYYSRGLDYSAQGKKATALKDFQKAADLYQKQGNTKLCNDTLARIKENQV